MHDQRASEQRALRKGEGQGHRKFSPQTLQQEKQIKTATYFQSENKGESASYPPEHFLYRVAIVEIERASKEAKDWEKAEKEIMEREKKMVSFSFPLARLLKLLKKYLFPFFLWCLQKVATPVSRKVVGFFFYFFFFSSSFSFSSSFFP